MAKYRLKSSTTLLKKKVDKVCISCGHRKPGEVSIYPGGILPNTTQKIVKGFLGPRPGTRLGCFLGNHDYYFEYELEKIS